MLELLNQLDGFEASNKIKAREAGGCAWLISDCLSAVLPAPLFHAPVCPRCSWPPTASTSWTPRCYGQAASTGR
jgi:hypothetical protein